MKNVFVTSLAMFAALATAMPTSAPVETDATLALRDLESRAVTCTRASVDRLAFSVSMSTFQKARKTKNPSQCVWTSDGCSKSPDRPLLFNFKPSCQRHDFGYRNTKKQKRFTKAMKARIDLQFKNDLYKYCATFTGLRAPLRPRCRRIADIYYIAVRKFGRRDLDAINAEAIAKRDEEVSEDVYEKRDEALQIVDESLEDFDGDEVDPDIEGQEIPEVVDEEEEDEDIHEDVEAVEE